MADQDKSEGQRGDDEQQESGQQAARDQHPERNYPGDDTDDAGGITNRPLSDEVRSQESLPERGTQKAETADPGSARRDGEPDVLNRSVEERYETPRRYEEATKRD